MHADVDNSRIHVRRHHAKQGFTNMIGPVALADTVADGMSVSYLVDPPVHKLVKLNISTATLVQQLHGGCQLIVIQTDVLL